MQGSATISIDDTIAGNINLPARGYAGIPFNGSVFVDGNGQPIPRFPFTSTELTATPDVERTITLNAPLDVAANWNNGRCNFDCQADGACELEFALSHSADELATKNIDILPAETYIFIDAPGSLHVYGIGRSLRIELVIDGEPPASGVIPSVTAAIGDDAATISDYLEMADGSAIDFTTGWSGGVWSGQVRAKSSASASDCLLKLTATYGSGNDAVSCMGHIYIDTALYGAVEISASRIAVGQAFNVRMSLQSSAGEVLTRLPSSGGVTVTHGPDDGSSATMLVNGSEPVFVFESGVCELIECTVDAECVYCIDMALSNDATVGDMVYVGVAPTASYNNLLEAINERRLAKGGTALDTSVVYSLSELKSYGEDAIGGFVNGALDENNGVTTFSGSDNLPSVPAEQSGEDEWIAGAYSVVCSAVEFYDDIGWYDEDAQRIRNTSSMYGYVVDLDGIWNAAEQREKVRKAIVEMPLEREDLNYSPPRSVDSVWIGYDEIIGRTVGNIKLEHYRTRYKYADTAGKAYFSRRANLVMKVKRADWGHCEFNNFGVPVPAENKYGVVNKISAGRNEDFSYGGWIGYLGGCKGLPTHAEGYETQESFWLLTYSFKHR